MCLCVYVCLYMYIGVSTSHWKLPVFSFEFGINIQTARLSEIAFHRKGWIAGSHQLWIMLNDHHIGEYISILKLNYSIVANLRDRQIVIKTHIRRLTFIEWDLHHQRPCAMGSLRFDKARFFLIVETATDVHNSSKILFGFQLNPHGWCATLQIHMFDALRWWINLEHITQILFEQFCKQNTRKSIYLFCSTQSIWIKAPGHTALPFRTSFGRPSLRRFFRQSTNCNAINKITTKFVRFLSIFSLFVVSKFSHFYSKRKHDFKTNKRLVNDSNVELRDQTTRIAESQLVDVPSIHGKINVSHSTNARTSPRWEWNCARREKRDGYRWRKHRTTFGFIWFRM